MMEQYRSIRKGLPPDTVLFFRLGDFYEMFFEDAVKASEILNITLTSRDGGAVGRVPMCGIPAHACQPYLRALLDHQLKVAICEQLGDPQTSRSLMERRVTRIITPATYLDEEAKSTRPEYMAAVAMHADEMAVAVLDVGTGEFFVRRVDPDRLMSELALLAPCEVILPKGLEGSGALADQIRSQLKATLTVYEDWVFDPKEGIRLIRECFSLASDRAIPFWDRPQAVAAAGAVLYYLKDHLHMALGHIRLPVLLESESFMHLDPQAVRSLELIPAPSDDRRSLTLLGILDKTLTPMGARTLAHWVTHPLVRLPEILMRQEGTAELVQHADLTQRIRGLLKGLKDIERILSRLNVGVANARDLIAIRLFLDRVPSFQEILKGTQSAILDEIRQAWNPLPELRDRIARGLVDDPPQSVREGGLIREGYSPELDELRALADKGKRWLAEFEKREIERTGIKSLRIRYNQVFGYSIEVSKPNLHLVPKDYIRKQTLANAERFVVPELVQWDERIATAQERIRELEYRLFQELRLQILEHLSQLQAMARALGLLDALASLAWVAIQNRWIRPELSESTELVIRGGRHPVVEASLPPGQFVENDTEMDGDACQLIVLTGPNMAGKSTYIRQVALIVLLAQMGSFVPAESARIGLVDRLLTRVGAKDDLTRGESTFMVEMMEMAHILRSATGKSLLILDEVGRGTSTFDGVSLAWAICEYLVLGKIRPRTLFATHYHELIQLEGQLKGVRNYSVTVRETSEGIVFLRKVVPGGSDRSYGIHVARLAGLPGSVTERAEQILRVLESENTKATEIIQDRIDLALEWAGGIRADAEDFKALNPILEEIRSLSVDRMTPLEALNRLAEWARRLHASESG